jgi:hypothetical protein
MITLAPALPLPESLVFGANIINYVHFEVAGGTQMSREGNLWEKAKINLFIAINIST